MRLKKWRIVSNRHDPPPKCRAAVCGRAGPRGRFLAVLRQFASSLSPRGVYFIIRRSERLERTRRRGGFDAAPPHGQDYFWGENQEFLETFPIWFFLLGIPQCQIYPVLTTPQKIRLRNRLQLSRSPIDAENQHQLLHILLRSQKFQSISSKF